MNTKRTYTLNVVAKNNDTAEYMSIFFAKPEGFEFVPGSCFDLSFKADDFSEGRIFSFSSSPTEEHLRITFKKGITEYKKRLERVHVGDVFSLYYYGTQYTFFPERPMIFYAGGIGIAVFRSIIKQYIDTNKSVSIALIYSSSTEFPFKEELVHWGKTRQQSVFFWDTKKEGRLDKEKLETILNVLEKPFEHYIIGPPGMVDETKEILQSLSIDPSVLHTDSFDGY